jgi:hypothetical protein
MVIHLPQFISVSEYAKRRKLTVRTTRSRMRKRKIGYEKICGMDMIIMPVSGDIPAVDLKKLAWVRTFAVANSYAPDTFYEHIIMNNINAFIIANRIFINPEEESVITFLKNNPPKKYRSWSERH